MRHGEVVVMTLYNCISLTLGEGVSPHRLPLDNVIKRAHHRGMLACFFQGLTCFLLASTSRSLQSFLRVLDGSMMSSTKPKFGPKKKPLSTNTWRKTGAVRRDLKSWDYSPLTAAGKGLANFSTYSASASLWLSLPLKMIWTAP